MKPCHQKRISAFIRRMTADKVDAFIVTKPENIFYLTSFLSDASTLVMNCKKSFVITDGRYIEAAGKQLKSRFELFALDHRCRTLAGAIAAVLGSQKAKRVGFESRAVTFAQYRSMKLAIKGRAIIPVPDAVESLREIKDACEIGRLRDALSITRATMEEVRRLLRPQLTELAVSQYIKESFIRKGADGAAFEPIIATQPGASHPHHHINARSRIGNNKPVLIDMGARYRGYTSDLTRVCILGKIKDKFKTIYNILLSAQEKAIEAIMPGARISDLDNAARQYIHDMGFGRFFVHSLGHGIGLEVHEKPAISCENNETLKEGMVFTVEPGIYIPGYGGLRVEDTVQVTKEGCRILTDDINK